MSSIYMSCNFHVIYLNVLPRYFHQLSASLCYSYLLICLQSSSTYVTFFSFPVIFSTVFIVFQFSIYRFSVVYLSVLRCSVTYLLHLSFHVPIFYLSVIPFPVIFSSFFSVPAVNLSDLLFLPSIYHLSVFLPCMAMLFIYLSYPVPVI